MDTKHRHELEQNDLQEFLTHFGSWWSRFGTWVLVILLVLVALIAGWRFFSDKATQQRERVADELATATDPASLRALGQEQSGRPALASLAYLRSGDLWLARLTRPQTAGTAAVTTAPSPEDREKAILEAEKSYTQASRIDSAPLATRLNALLGLAAVAEARQDWDQAAQHYQQVIDQAQGQLPTIQTQAQGRANLLQRLRQPILYAPEAATQPMSLRLPALSQPATLAPLNTEPDQAHTQPNPGNP